jgi:hypothetical protein
MMARQQQDAIRKKEEDSRILARAAVSDEERARLIEQSKALTPRKAFALASRIVEERRHDMQQQSMGDDDREAAFLTGPEESYTLTDALTEFAKVAEEIERIRRRMIHKATRDNDDNANNDDNDDNVRTSVASYINDIIDGNGIIGSSTDAKNDDDRSLRLSLLLSAVKTKSVTDSRSPRYRHHHH